MPCEHSTWTDLPDTIGGPYRRCAACGLEEQLSLGELEDRFSEAQDEWYGASEPACLTPFALALSEGDATYRLGILQSVAPSGRVLEIGPGSGQFAELAAAAGYDVVAIEDSPVLAAAVRTRGVAVHEGTFETLDIDPASFDVIVSWHVIEHVLDPVAFLAAAASVTKPGGHLLLATPNATSWQHRLARGQSPNYSFPHLRLFTAESLIDVMAAAGWRPIDTFTTDEPEHWMKVGAGVVRALASRRSPGRAGAESAPLAVETISARTGMAAVHLAGVLTWLPRQAQVRLGRGNEVVAVGRLVGADG